MSLACITIMLFAPLSVNFCCERCYYCFFVDTPSYKTTLGFGFSSSMPNNFSISSFLYLLPFGVLTGVINPSFSQFINVILLISYSYLTFFIVNNIHYHSIKGVSFFTTNSNCFDLLFTLLFMSFNFKFFYGVILIWTNSSFSQGNRNLFFNSIYSF